MALAVKNGHSDVVQWLLVCTRKTRRVRDDVFIQAVLAGNLPIVKFLIYGGFPVTDSHRLLVELPTLRGHLELLQWLVERNFLDGERHVQLSSKHLDVNKWLMESGLESGVEKAFAVACGEGPLPVVWWLADYMDTRGINLDVDTAKAALDSVAGHGRLEVVKWLLERDLGRGTTLAIHAAAMNGHLEVAKYLHPQGFTGCNQGTVQMAASGGHLSVVKWLWTLFHDDPKAGFLYVEDGVQWVSPLRCQMALAACNGHLEVIQYLHTIVLSLAEEKRKQGEISRHSRGIEMDDVVAEAARHGYMDLVQWLCANTTVKSFEGAIAGAANRGHFAVVKWLHENRPNETFQDEVMDEAAGCGDLSLLKWLHTKRPNKRWSTDGIEYAAQGGHLYILRWVLDNELLSLHENDVPVDAMNLARRKKNHFDALLFLYYEYKDRSSDGVKLVDDPYHIYNEHLEDWFQEEMGYFDEDY